MGPPSPVRRSKSGDSGERVTETASREPPRRQDPAASREPAHEEPEHARRDVWEFRDRDEALRRERGLAGEPGARRLELRAEAEQRRLVAEARDELDRDGQPARGVAERQHHGGLAGQVEPHRERREREDAAPVLLHVVHHHVDPAELDRELAEARGQQHVVAGVEGRHLPAQPVGGLGGPHVVRRAGALADAGGVPGDRLHLALDRGPARGRMGRQVHHRVHRGQGDEGGDHHAALDLRVGLLHVMAELGAEPHRLLEGGEALGVDGRAVGGQRGVGDAQRPRRGPALLEVGPRGRRGGVGIPGPRPVGGVEQRRAVPHRERHRVLGGAAAEALAGDRREGVAPPRGLEPDQPAARGGRADGAEAVAGVRHREHARAHRGGGPAARAGGDAGRVPRIAGRPVESGLAGEREAHLAAVGPAEDHEPGALEPGHVLAVERGRRGVGEEPAAPRHGRPGERGAQVLQEKRHAAERSVGKPVGDRAAAVVVERHDHRVHLGLRA